MDVQPFLTIGQAVADALNEFLLGFVRRMLPSREDYDVLAVVNDGIGLVIGLDTLGNTACAEQRQGGGDADETQASHAIRAARARPTATAPRRPVVRL